MIRVLALAAALVGWAPAVQARTALSPRAAEAPPAAEAIPRGRLSDLARPVAYRLDLTVDPAQPRFAGRVEIDVVLARPTSRLFLHGRDLTVPTALARVGGAPVAATWTQVDPTGVARLDFATPLPAGAVTLALDYTAAFNDNPVGLFRLKIADRWYGWTQFESIDARAAFPGFDQPSFKQPFTVTLRTPPGLVAVSNAPEQGVTREAGLDVHRFAPTRPLPTYLVAMMVGPFATATTAVPPTPQRTTPLPVRIVAAQPSADGLAYARDNTGRIVTLLEDYFGGPFPFAKLDQIAVPTLGGAMENAGADLYDDSILILDAKASTARRRTFGMVVAHELSHQWFGDLVTPGWWDDIWLNESFANWMGYRIGDAWMPSLHIRSGAIAEGFAAMATDALIAGRPIRQPIATSDQIDAAFDTVTYGKGGQVVAMIAQFLGDTRFRDGVRAYLAAHRYGNATSADFFAALSRTAGDPRIVAAMRSFTDRQGVPLLTFVRAGDGWRVTQSRYLAFGTSAPAQRWGVPLCVRRDGQPTCTLLTEAGAELTVAGAGPLIPNAGGAGYYRFALPAAGWDALIAGAAALDDGEAQAAVDSLGASIRAGQPGVARLARLAAALADRPDSYAAAAAPAALAALADDFADARARAAWRRWLGRMYAPRLAALGFDPRVGAYAREAGETAHRRHELATQMLASDRDAAVRTKLVAAARAHLAGDPRALDPAYFDLAFRALLDADGQPGARRLLNAALASEDPAFRPAALGALGASGSPAIADRLVALADPRLRQNERRVLLTAVTEAPATRDIGYRWVVAHLDELTSGANGIFYAARMPDMLARFCSVARADAIARDLQPRLKGTPGELALARAIERVRDCGRLKDARGARIGDEFARLR